jgi:uncharacterized Zn-binding protein involved in type VI secretion
MSVKRRLAIVCGATVAATTLMVGGPTALAAPAEGGVEFTVNCPGLDEFVVVATPGDAPFAPVFIPGTHQLFIPYQLTGTVTVDGQVVEEIDDVKNAPLPADAIACTFEGTITEGDVTVTLAGTAVVVQRGAP